MSLPRLSQRQKAGLAVLLALALWAPTGLSHEDQTIVTGHSTFYNGDVYDKCLGSIAGIIKSKVRWFNDAILVERYSGKGTFIFVTEAGAPDPRIRELRSEGVFYDFVDPNGAHWHIEESFMAEGINGDFFVNDDPLGNDKPLAEVHTATNRTYVWTVELSARPIYDDFAGSNPHTYYNFLTLVDTCKFHPYVPNDVESHSGAVLNDDNGHANDDAAHEHQAWDVNLWVGTAPTIVPIGGASTDGAEWETEWASQEGAQTAQENGVDPDTGEADPDPDPSDLGDLAP